MGTRPDAGSSLDQKPLAQPSLATPFLPWPRLLFLPHPSAPPTRQLQNLQALCLCPSVPGQSRYAPTSSYCPLCIPSFPPEPVSSTFITHLSRPLNMCTSCSVHDWAPTSLILGRTPVRSWRFWLEKGISEFSSLEVGSSERVPLWKSQAEKGGSF